MRATFRDGTDYDALIERTLKVPSILRHDTCGNDCLDHAVEFARMEHERGLRATYFIWQSLVGFGKPRMADQIREIRALGHGIGLHYDALHRLLRDGTQPRVSIAKALDWLRTTGDVTLAAAHGQESSYVNHMREYEVWREFSPVANEGGGASTWEFERLSGDEFGVIEVYLTGDYNVSLSDSRGIWSGWRDLALRPFERIDPAHDRKLAILDTLGDGDRLHLLTHPVWWELSE